MDESRKQFEEWFKSQYPETADIHLCVTGGGSDLVKLLFLAWQDSRKAIEIEPLSHFQAVNAIPRSQTSLTDAVKIGYLMCAEVAGIKVKE